MEYGREQEGKEQQNGISKNHIIEIWGTLTRLLQAVSRSSVLCSLSNIEDGREKSMGRYSQTSQLSISDHQWVGGR